MKKTAEEEKYIRRFLLIIIWTLFVVLTVSGLVYAGAATAYTYSKEEHETVKCDIEEEVKSYLKSNYNIKLK